MASRSSDSILAQVESLFGPGTLAGLSERQLLERFLTERDPAAFEAIVTRHGPMVLGVCRRWLADPHDADDAFQATFLILVRKAGSLRNRDVLASWLYGVANRVARRARQQAASRHRREAAAAVGRGREEAVSTMTPTEFGPELHQEIDRLPSSYRAAIVLCYLEGRTHEEAAQELGWPVGTVKGRLARARDLLRQRLVRRGVAVPSLVLVATLQAHAARVSPTLLAATVQSAVTLSTGKLVAAGTLSASVVTLTREVLNAMTFTKLTPLILGGAVLAVSILSGVHALAQLPIQRRHVPAPGAGQVAMLGGAGRQPAGPGAQELAQLTGSRADVARRAFEAVKEFYENGTVSLDAYLRSSQQWLDADLDLTKDPVGRLAAYQAAVDRLAALSERERAKQEAGASALPHVLRAELALIEAKIALAKEREHTAGMMPGMAGGGAAMSASVPGMMVSSSGGGMQMASASAGGGGGGMQTAMGGGTGPGGAMGGAMGGGFAGGGESGGDEEHEQRVRQARPKLFRAIDEDARTQAIVAKLNEVHDFPFANETPLEDVIKYIRAETKDAQFPNGISIYVDPAGLQEAEKTLQSPVQIELEGVPIRTALRLTLKQLGLVYVVKEGLLMISYPESESLLDELECEPES